MNPRILLRVGTQTKRLRIAEIDDGYLVSWGKKRSWLIPTHHRRDEIGTMQYVAEIVRRNIAHSH